MQSALPRGIADRVRQRRCTTRAATRASNRAPSTPSASPPEIAAWSKGSYLDQTGRVDVGSGYTLSGEALPFVTSVQRGDVGKRYAFGFHSI